MFITIADLFFKYSKSDLILFSSLSEPANKDNWSILPTILKSIFSFVILIPVAVIIAGKFLSKVFSLKLESRQVFKLPLGILQISAEDDEVIWGFSSFIICLTFVTILIGQEKASNFIKDRMVGISTENLEPFTCLCILGSFVAVISSVLLYSISQKIQNNTRNKIFKEQKELFNKVIKQKGCDL